MASACFVMTLRKVFISKYLCNNFSFCFFIFSILFERYSTFFSGLLVVSLSAKVWTHVEIEAEDYFFPLEPVSILL